MEAENKPSQPPKKIIDPKASEHDQQWKHIKEPPRDTHHKGGSPRHDGRHS